MVTNQGILFCSSIFMILSLVAQGLIESADSEDILSDPVDFEGEYSYANHRIVIGGAVVFYASVCFVVYTLTSSEGMNKEETGAVVKHRGGKKIRTNKSRRFRNGKRTEFLKDWL